MSCEKWRLSRNSGGCMEQKYPWKSLDAGALDGNHEGGRRGGSTCQIEIGVI